MLKKLVMTLALGSSLFAMHEAELNLNNYDLGVNLNLDMGQFSNSVDPDSVFFGAGYLHGSHQHNESADDKDHDLFDLHFLVKQRLKGSSGLTAGLGTKLVYTTVGGYDYYALPIGAMLDYELPLGLSIPFIVGGSFYYAPQVLSWQDAKDYMDYGLHLDIRLIDRAAVTAGYRHIDTNFDVSGGDYTFNDSWYVGVKFRF